MHLCKTDRGNTGHSMVFFAHFSFHAYLAQCGSMHAIHLRCVQRNMHSCYRMHD